MDMTRVIGYAPSVMADAESYFRPSARSGLGEHGVLSYPGINVDVTPSVPRLLSHSHNDHSADIRDRQFRARSCREQMQQMKW
jgi:hypothetical protein